ncbi:hypothetical protein Tco_0812323, partial [Tanacetum coccineum]
MQCGYINCPDLSSNEDNIFPKEMNVTLLILILMGMIAQSIFMANLSLAVYDQKTKTALGAQNPFYLRQAKKAQPALYDGDELLKPHHVPVIVPSPEEELELAEATRNKLHVKMNDSTYLAKRKAEELKSNAPPLPVLPPATVYPPNTPVNLVPRMLPTTSQVNIGLSFLEQRFNCKAQTTDQNNSLLSEIENLKAQLKDNSKCVTIPDSKPKVLALGRYPRDVEPIPPRLKKNQEVHLHYIKHLKENVETLR